MKLKNIYKLAWVLPIVMGLIFMAYTPDIRKENQDNKEQKEKKEEKVITLDKSIHDFGTVSEEGGEVSTIFKFTNNMEVPVNLTNVVVQCGCSNSTWTKEPIAPGKTGEVKVSFNPRGQYGPFEKNITVNTSGTPNRIILKIKGIVE